MTSLTKFFLVCLLIATLLVAKFVNNVNLFLGLE